LTFQIWQNYMAPVGFLPEPDFCRIWKKLPDSGLHIAAVDFWCQKSALRASIFYCFNNKSV